jgi:putative hydrolase of HD superfamily
MMALVHDLAEAQGTFYPPLLSFLPLLMFPKIQVGDIAPKEGIPKVEKHRLEAVCCTSFFLSFISHDADAVRIQEAMHNFLHEMLHDSPAAQRIDALWKVSFLYLFF